MANIKSTLESLLAEVERKNQTLDQKIERLQKELSLYNEQDELSKITGKVEKQKQIENALIFYKRQKAAEIEKEQQKQIKEYQDRASAYFRNNLIDNIEEYKSNTNLESIFNILTLSQNINNILGECRELLNIPKYVDLLDVYLKEIKNVKKIYNTEILLQRKKKDFYRKKMKNNVRDFNIIMIFILAILKLCDTPKRKR